MSKLHAGTKTVYQLFSDGGDFLIPDYQRQYSWGKEQCQELWEDIESFAFPDDEYEEFDQKCAIFSWLHCNF